MSWLPFTSDQVLSEFTAPELATINEVQGSENLPAIVARVVAEVRGCIQAGGYPLDETPGTLPEGLHNLAIDLARWRFLMTAPDLAVMQTEGREKANDRAEKKLRAIAAQEYAVVPPPAGAAGRSGSWNSENKLAPRMHPIPPLSTQSSQRGYPNPNGPADN